MRTFQECLSDPEEQPYLVALINKATDPSARAAYAEFLQRKNDPRAEAVRIANQLLAGVADNGERKRLAAQLLEARKQFDEPMEKLLLVPIAVHNCGEKIAEGPRARFRFECDQWWGDMRPTDDEKLRFCERCSSGVIRCDTMAEVERHARLGACITVNGALVSEAYESLTRGVTGRPDVFGMWAEQLFK